MKVVMSDWASDLYISSNAISPLYELLLLSLVYDEILIPDETFVLSEKLARWYARPNHFQLLEKVFRTNGVTVLKHPLKDYRDKRLAEKANQFPISARADYISQRGTRADHPFQPKPVQRDFYRKLEASLGGEWQREVGSKPGLPRAMPIMQAFARTVRSVLSDTRYRPWIKSAFGRLSDRVLDDFLVCVEKPERAVDKITKHRGKENTRVLRTGSAPVFNRSLAYQVADAYRSHEISMRRFIQSTFYAPFCKNERAVGRYSRFLHELLVLPENSRAESGSRQPIVGVDVSTVPLRLPELTAPFVDAFQEVRESAEGRALRRSMAAASPAFQMQLDHWRAVADLLARKMVPYRKFEVRPAAIGVGGGMVFGVTATDLYSRITSAPAPNIRDSIIVKALSAAMGLVCNHVYAIMQTDLQQQRLRSQLEDAVAFRCTDIPLPARFLS